MHHPILLWRDLRAGVLGQTRSQLRVLRAGEADAVLVVGDVFAQAMAAVLGAPRRFVLQPLVSVRMADGGGRVAWNRAFMERMRALDHLLLRRAGGPRRHRRRPGGAPGAIADGVRHVRAQVWARVRGRPVGGPQSPRQAPPPIGGGASSVRAPAMAASASSSSSATRERQRSCFLA